MQIKVESLAKYGAKRHKKSPKRKFWASFFFGISIYRDIDIPIKLQPQQRAPQRELRR